MLTKIVRYYCMDHRFIKLGQLKPQADNTVHITVIVYMIMCKYFTVLNKSR